METIFLKVQYLDILTVILILSILFYLHKQIDNNGISHIVIVLSCICKWVGVLILLAFILIISGKFITFHSAILLLSNIIGYGSSLAIVMVFLCHILPKLYPRVVHYYSEEKVFERKISRDFPFKK